MSHSKLSLWEVKLYIFSSINGYDGLFWCKIKFTTRRKKTLFHPVAFIFQMHIKWTVH